MLLLDLTIERVRQELDRPVPELHLAIAKHLVVGMDARGIADVFGVTAEDVREIEEDSDFEEVRLFVAAAYADAQTDSDISWDAVEQQALKNLSLTVSNNKDPELNLRIAAVANKASRRHRAFTKPLDSSGAGRIVKLTLTERTVRRLEVSDVKVIAPHANGVEVLPSESPANEGEAVERELTVEVESSSASPSFAEIDQLLGVSRGTYADVVESATPLTPDDIVEGIRRG